MTATITDQGRERAIEGRGNGPIDAFVDALRGLCGKEIRVIDYSEHAIGGGADAAAAAYVELRIDGEKPLFGAGIDGNIVTASLQAVVSAVNRALRAP
jgi:2-isopropylmalate synthase